MYGNVRRLKTLKNKVLFCLFSYIVFLGVPRRSINQPESHVFKEAAGKDWLEGFKKRGKRITLRQPEAASIARAMGINKTNALTFFVNVFYRLSKSVVTPHLTLPQKTRLTNPKQPRFTKKFLKR